MQSVFVTHVAQIASLEHMGFITSHAPDVGEAILHGWL
jgi:hypothetical protein